MANPFQSISNQWSLMNRLQEMTKISDFYSAITERMNNLSIHLIANSDFTSICQLHLMLLKHVKFATDIVSLNPAMAIFQTVSCTRKVVETIS